MNHEIQEPSTDSVLGRFIVLAMLALAVGLGGSSVLLRAWMRKTRGERTQAQLEAKMLSKGYLLDRPAPKSGSLRLSSRGHQRYAALEEATTPEALARALTTALPEAKGPAIEVPLEGFERCAFEALRAIPSLPSARRSRALAAVIGMLSEARPASVEQRATEARLIETSAPAIQAAMDGTASATPAQRAALSAASGSLAKLADPRRAQLALEGELSSGLARFSAIEGERHGDALLAGMFAGAELADMRACYLRVLATCIEASQQANPSEARDLASKARDIVLTQAPRAADKRLLMFPDPVAVIDAELSCRARCALSSLALGLTAKGPWPDTLPASAPLGARLSSAAGGRRRLRGPAGFELSEPNP